MSNALERVIARFLFGEVNPNIENKQKQIERLHNSMPSRENRMKVSPRQKLNTQKQINTLKNQIVDERLKNLDKKET
jgi:peptidoglycan hydrolase CwlO-like protein